MSQLRTFAPLIKWHLPLIVLERVEHLIVSTIRALIALSVCFQDLLHVLLLHGHLLLFHLDVVLFGEHVVINHALSDLILHF